MGRVQRGAAPGGPLSPGTSQAPGRQASRSARPRHVGAHHRPLGFGHAGSLAARRRAGSGYGGGGARQGTGLLEGTDLEPTARYEGGGQGTRQRTSTDQRGQVRTRAVTVYGWKLRVRLEAMPQSPLAAQVVQLQDQAATVPRPLVTRRAPSWPTLPAGSGSSWTAGFWTGLPGGGWPRRACALWSQRQRTGA